MKNLPSFSLGIAACALMASTLIVAAPSRPSEGQEPSASAPDEGARLFNQMCSDCHDAARIVSVRRTKTEWEEVLNKMIEKGAIGSEKDFEGVFGYLLLNYGKIYINRAVPDEIVRILGLPKKDADAVVAYRTAHGPFADLDSIKKVPDIDVKKVEDHKDAITF
jgi:competence protein ComEA